MGSVSALCRRSFLPVTGLLLSTLSAGVLLAQPRRPGETKFPPKSGFYDLLRQAPEFESGLGNVSNFTCVANTASQPSVFAGNYLANCGPDVPHNETSIVVNPLDPNHVVGAFHTYALVATGGRLRQRVFSTPSVTTNGGATWRHVIPPVTPFQFTGDPAVAFNRQGRVYLASIADHEGQGGGGYTAPSVVVQYSDDGGTNWTNPIVVAPGRASVTVGQGNGPLVFQDKDYIAVDTFATSPFANRAYVTWTSFQEFFQGVKPYARSPITFSYSDNGTAWGRPMEISGFSSNCSAALFGRPNECDLNQFSIPAVAPNGRVYVGFENFNTEAENQYLIVSSSNGGSSWSGPVKVDSIHDINFPQSDGSDTVTGCAFRVAAPGNVGVDPGDPSGNTVYAVWADNRNGSESATNMDVFLGRSTDGGASWTAFIVDDEANDQFYPWVAVGPGGRVDVGYMDRSYSSGQAVCQYGFSLTRMTFTGDVMSGKTKSRVDTGLSDPGHSRWFSGSTGGNSLFLGDYNGVAVGSDGVTWSLWTDHRRVVPNPPSPTRNHGQDAVAAKTP